jgi:hypothetical protein
MHGPVKIFTSPSGSSCCVAFAAAPAAIACSTSAGSASNCLSVSPLELLMLTSAGSLALLLLVWLAAAAPAPAAPAAPAAGCGRWNSGKLSYHDAADLLCIRLLVLLLLMSGCCSAAASADLCGCMVSSPVSSEPSTADTCKHNRPCALQRELIYISHCETTTKQQGHCK